MVYTIDEASKVMGLGRTRIYEEINSGRLTALKSGKKTLIPKDSIAKWIDSLDLYPTR